MSCVTRNLKPLLCCESCHLATAAFAFSTGFAIQVSMSLLVSFARPKTPPPRPYSVRGSPNTRSLAATDAPRPMALATCLTPAADACRSFTAAARRSDGAGFMSAASWLAGSTMYCRCDWSSWTSAGRSVLSMWSAAALAVATRMGHSALGMRRYVSGWSGDVRTSGPPAALQTSSMNRCFSEASFRLWSSGTCARSSARSASTNLSAKRATG
mmetsp:Transcript_5621/g.15962  ORF Transcript_5621/g.15962 Transcript_5621/m.15962 type:complete len:213 (+) Transcript_5621:125-763(+)